MNWESIIIGIASSVIGGLITLIGNVILVNVKAKKKKEETVSIYERRMLDERFKVYNLLAIELDYIINHSDEIDELENTKFAKLYSENRLLFSDEVVKSIIILFRVTIEDEHIILRCENLIKKLKAEQDEYYHLDK